MTGNVDDLEDDIKAVVSDGPIGWTRLKDRLATDDYVVIQKATTELLDDGRIVYDAALDVYTVPDE